MNYQRYYRPSLLAIALGGSLLALVWGIKTPLLSRPTVATFDFPEKVPLSGWKQWASKPLDFPSSNDLTPIASKTYQYRSLDGSTLDIQMRYLKTAKADIPSLWREYSRLPPTPQIFNQPGIGAIAWTTYQNRLYLSACINPEGPSTVTADQYLRTKLVTGKNLDWFGAWLWGRADLLDQRCLWSHLSLALGSQRTVTRSPLENQEPHQVLQTVGKSWFEWWKFHYPPQ